MLSLVSGLLRQLALPGGEQQCLLPRQVDGARRINAAVYGSPLAALKMFSSIAGQLGSGGQANYAAANAMLDAWAHSAQAQARITSNQRAANKLKHCSHSEMHY